MNIPRAIFPLAILSFGLSVFAQRPDWDTRRMHNPALNMNEREGGSISGVVQDTNNAPLKDVRVELHDPSGMMVNDLYTDSAGAFEFSHVPPGTYDVVAS